MGKIITENEKNLAFADYFSGMTIINVCKKHNMVKSTFHKYMRERGIQGRGHGNLGFERKFDGCVRKKLLEDAGTIIDLYNNTLTIKKLAKLYGCTEKTMGKFIHSIEK